MMLFIRHYLNRCWLLYLVMGILLYRMMNHRMVDFQFLDNYKWAAAALMDCASHKCSEDVLKSSIHYYHHLSRISPEVSQQYNSLGYCFYALREYSRSLPYFSQAIQLNSKNPGLYFNKAMALLHLREYKKALDILKQGEVYFSPENFFDRYMVDSFRKASSGLSVEEKMSRRYFSAAFQYQELMTLTGQIVDSIHLDQKRILIDQLQNKIKEHRLYYYIPLYNLEYQGKKLNVI